MQLFQENISLRPYNTFGIDVNAKLFSSFANEDELMALLSEKTVQTEQRLFLGGGSNVLFTQDFNGVVMINRMKGIELIKEDDTYYYVKAMAGEVWHQFVMYCIQHDMAGIENLSLIPGSVGASPMQNIGAYGVEIKDVFHGLEAIHVKEKAKRFFNATECSFGYRESIFKRKEKDNWVITSVTFRLKKRPEFHTTYGAIQEELDKMTLDKMNIKAVSQAVINIRQSKLPDPKKLGNAGSFFKNPVVDLSVYQAIKEKYPNAPCYPIDEHQVKVPAGWLIETLGWKGKRIENHGVHEKQALVLVNYGGSTGQQIYDLSTAIIDDIHSTFGITLEREVNIY